MAQGPDGGGFKQGHRASVSLYADKSDTEATSTDETTVPEGKTSASGVATDDVAGDATASDVDVIATAVEEEQKAGET